MRRNTLLRQGRTCYDHLAGVAAVQLLDALLQRGWVEGHTGRRPHLGGALGAAILHALRRAGYIRRDRKSRAVTLIKPITDWLDTSPSAP